MSSHHNKKGLLREYLSDCITSATWTDASPTHASLDPCCCSRGIQHTVLPRHMAVAQCVNKTLFESATLDGRLRPHELVDAFELDEPRSAAMKQLVLELAPTPTPKSSTPLPRLTSMMSPTYETFFLDFLVKNEPALVEGLIDLWPMKKCSKEGGWLNETGNEVDMDHLIKLYGNETVHCQLSPTNNTKVQLPFSEFANQWKNTNTTHPPEPPDTPDIPVAPIYLKDWHPFIIPGSEHMASIPDLFQDDWFNEFLPTKRNVDYRFVYLGRKGTQTNLHADVMNTYSWSTNVCGRKRWLLLPPKHTHLLYDQFAQKLAPTFHPMYYASPHNDGASQTSTSATNGADHDGDPHQCWERNYPLLHLARPIEVLQEAGQTIFVPSGWHHTVENIDDTLSVNSNWCNATNIAWCFSDLVRSNKGMNTMLPVLRWKVDKCVARLTGVETRKEERPTTDTTSMAATTTATMTTAQLLAAFNLQRAGAVAHSLCGVAVDGAHFTAAERHEAQRIYELADQVLVTLKLPASSELPLLAVEKIRY